jgi:hypothetical protein
MFVRIYKYIDALDDEQTETVFLRQFYLRNLACLTAAKVIMTATQTIS